VLAGTLGGILAKWTTFVPSFLWIFLGAPYIEALQGNKALTAALSAITAAVVGVILNLAIWFALHTLFGQVDEQHAYGMVLQVPVLTTLNVASLVLSIAAMIAIFRFKAGMDPDASSMFGSRGHPAFRGCDPIIRPVKVALWTKSDSVTYFDTISIAPLG
jgi:chromate transport protein ChrA